MSREGEGEREDESSWVCAGSALDDAIWEVLSRRERERTAVTKTAVSR